MRWLWALWLIVGVGCKQSGDVLDCPDGEECEDQNPDTQYRARGVGIDQVAVYQSVRVPVVEDGQSASTNIPVIAGKEALMRVFLERASGFDSRDIVGRLTVDSGSGDATVYETTKNVNSGWSESDLDSTMNFTISAEDMTPGADFSLELLEAELGFESDEDELTALYPSDGMASMQAHDMGGPLKIYFLPVRYNADGSGRVPDLDEPRVNKFEREITALYPASTVEITVLEPLNWSYHVEAYGNGWGELLQQMYHERGRQSIPWDAYLYGIFKPDSSLNDYCYRGCILGLSSLAQSANDSWARVSIGLGFPGDTAIGTFMHEIGHAHGREHAPCETQDADWYYPYSGGMIGSWGYDSDSGKMMNPSSYADFMGYCEPSWISDYTYKALHQRIRAVNGASDFAWSPETPRTWQMVFVDGEGQTKLGPVVEPERPPVGLSRMVNLRNARGQVVETVEGHFAPYDHLPGGVMLVPELAVDVVDVSL